MLAVGLPAVETSGLAAFFAVTLAADGLLRPTAGVDAGQDSAISMPNTSATNASSSTLRAAGRFLDSGRPVLTRPMRSLASTRRKAKRNSGCWSSRAPTPYSTAATCLHIDAQ